MRRSGVRIPLAPPQTDIRSGCRFFVCLGVSLRRAAGVPGAGGPAVGPGCSVCPWAAARPRAVRAASFARRVASKPGQALPPPTGTAAWPSGPSGALHTGGTWCTDGVRSPARPRHRPRARQPGPPDPPAPSTPAAPGVLMVFEARPGPATARGHRSLAPHTPASYTPAAPAVLCVLAPVSKPARALRTLRCPPRQWCLAADVWLGASARSSAWSCRWPRAPQPGPTAAHRCGR